MPYKLLKATPALLRAYDAAYGSSGAEDDPCPALDYHKYSIVPITVEDGQFITYSTPDSAFAVTKRRIERAQRKILIGIYDFTARHMRDLLLAAVGRGVQVTLMLDCNFHQLPGEESIFRDLQSGGVRCVPAPSCQGGTNRYFRVAHEKVIVIDDIWTLVQSGNYSNNSIPFNQRDGIKTANFQTGNRDMGIAIKSAEVAAFFTKVIEDDIRRELSATDNAAEDSSLHASLPPLFEAVRKSVEFELFPSERFTPAGAVHVLPVLTPDNYMDVVPDFILSATRSVYIEQQYIRNINLSGNASVERLVRSINPELDVRIIVAPPFSESREDRNKLRGELDALASVGLATGANVRLLNKQHLKHCHNKLVIIDEEKVLISSQNWSEPAVTVNREAGIIIVEPDIAAYYARIFKEDWKHALQSLNDATDTELLMLDEPTPKNVRAVLDSGQFTAIDWGDYADI